MPPSETRPASGRSNPAMSRSVVVLPEPDGPSMVKNSPLAMSRSTSSTAATSPNCLRSPVRETSGGADGVAKRLLHDLEAAVDVLIRGDERDEDAQYVAVEAAGQEHESAVTSICGRLRRKVGSGLLGVRVVHELQGEHRADSAHFADLRDALRHVVKSLSQAAAHVLRLLEHVAVHERVEGGVRGRAGQRVAAERAAQPAGRNRIHDFGTPGYGGERHAAAERLAGYQQVGLDVPVFDCPQRACASGAGLHLVVYVD